MRPTTVAIALAVTALAPAAAQAAGPPPMRVSVGDSTLTIQSHSYIWKGVTADSLPVGQMTKLPRLVVPRGETVSFRIGYGPREVTIAEVLPGGFRGTTVKRVKGSARTGAWKPRLVKGSANVEVFVRTAQGYASYALQLARG